MNEVATVAEINDAEIDVDALMHRLRDRFQSRQRQAQSQGKDYLRLVDDPVPPPEAGMAEHELVEHLRVLLELGDSLRQVPVVTDWQLPIGNGLINRLKRPLHELVVTYVNRLAVRQMVVNRQVRRSLLSMVEGRQTDAARIAALEQQVAQLRDQLAAHGSGAARGPSQVA